MDFFLAPKFPAPSVSFAHNNAFLLLGSCFSDEMSLKFKNAGFSVKSNPFGTVFHPICLANILDLILENTLPDLTESNGNWFSWDMSHKLSFPTQNALRVYLENEISSSRETLLDKHAVLVVTFGTAWGYRLKDNQYLVANCHKFPADSFFKELTDIDLIFSAWSEIIRRLKKFNPKITICFTVSPVRHVRDGIIENNRSKARCMETIQRIQEEFNEVQYLPSYELVLDVLRDYRFYGVDRVHPTAEAINYVWEYICSNWVAEKAIPLIKDTERYYRQVAHELLTNNPEEVKNHTKRLSELKAVLKEKGAHL